MFEYVTVKAGVTTSKLAVGGAWLDYDNDGNLDSAYRALCCSESPCETFCGNQRARIYSSFCHPRIFQ